MAWTEAENHKFATVDPLTGEKTAIEVTVISCGTTGDECVDTSFSFRTDTAWVHDFVAEYH